MPEPTEYAPSDSEMSDQEWLSDLKKDDEGFAAAAQAMKSCYQAMGRPHPISDDQWYQLAQLAFYF